MAHNNRRTAFFTKNTEAIANYYLNLFPVEEVVRLLSLHCSLPFREIASSYTLRFNSVANAEDLRAFCLDTPLRLDVGAAYDIANGTHPMSECQPVGREFTIDYDFTDFCEYCDAATKKVCPLCWETTLVPLIKKTQQVISLLTSKFVIFCSGGKGFHVWIFDPYLFFYTDEERKQLVEAIKQELGFEIDEEVSVNVKHTIRLPFSLNEQFLCAPLDLKDVSYLNSFFSLEQLNEQLIQKLVQRTKHIQ
jgi:DNA primase catalytic subunit